MKPNPGTPLCAIKGCEKRVRRLGMCAEHAALVTAGLGEEAAVAANEAALRAAARVRRQAQAEVRKVLRDRAS